MSALSIVAGGATSGGGTAGTDVSDTASVAAGAATAATGFAARSCLAKDRNAATPAIASPAKIPPARQNRGGCVEVAGATRSPVDAAEPGSSSCVGAFTIEGRSDDAITICRSRRGAARSAARMSRALW